MLKHGQARRTSRRHGLVTTAALLLTTAPALAAPELAAHRAVYDMELAKAAAGSAVAGVRGRYVFDFRGSACAGYRLTTRLVTEIVDREGKTTLSDTSASSTEAPDGEALRFANVQSVNRGTAERVAGLATRAGETVAVMIETPERKTAELAAATMFPAQHSQALIAAAQDGRTRLVADFYDGSEKGTKTYETVSVLGVAASAPPVAANDAGTALDALRSWPVTISYYERGAVTTDAVPAYELHFRLYENGISRALTIDYGAFKLTGKLVALDLMPQEPCP